MKQWLFFSDYSWTGTILRLTLGIVMFPHGTQKLFGLFGGFGFSVTMRFFTETVKLPGIIALAVIMGEFLGSVALIMGVQTRLCTIVLMVIMAGAIQTTTYANGFFMNWFGTQKGEGYEFNLLVIGLCLALMTTGGGRYALDNWLSN